MTVKYQITLTDVLDHDTVLWEGDDLQQGQAQMEHLYNVGPQGYDMYLTLEEVFLCDDGTLDYYEVIEGIEWYETVEEWEEANPQDR